MIKIITDTTCDLPKGLIEKYNIKSLPITIDIDGNSYKDGIDISTSEFYSKIKDTDTLPKTAQINPLVFEETFKEELDKGNKIICITISSKLSGTYNSAHIAKNSLGSDDIHIIDSKGASMTYGLVVLEVVKMINLGLDIHTIIEKTNDFINRQKSIVFINSLEMLKKGGRLSPSSIFIGSLLNIKPIIEFKDGELVATNKVRGRKKAFKHLADFIKNHNIDESVDIYVTHSNDTESCTEMIKLLNSNGIHNNIKVAEIGPAVGTHLGEGAIAIFFAEKK